MLEGCHWTCRVRRVFLGPQNDRHFCGEIGVLGQVDFSTWTQNLLEATSVCDWKLLFVVDFQRNPHAWIASKTHVAHASPFESIIVVFPCGMVGYVILFFGE